MSIRETNSSPTDDDQDLLDVRIELEAHLIPAVNEHDTLPFNFTCKIPGPTRSWVEITVDAEGELVIVSISSPVWTLRRLDDEWDYVTHPKPPVTPRPRETRFADHGEDYEAYRDMVVRTVTTELGLLARTTVEDAVVGDDDLAFVCEPYETASQRFGPDADAVVTYSCGFDLNAF